MEQNQRGARANMVRPGRRRGLLAIALFVVVAIGALVLVGQLRSISAAERVYTVPDIELQLAQHAHQWLGRTIVVQGQAAPVDAATIYSQYHPPLPHTFVLLAPQASSEAPQLWVVYTPGHSTDQSILTTLVHHFPFLQAIVPPQRTLAEAARYRLRLEAMPQFATTCPVSACYYARLVSDAPAFQ